MVFAIEGHHFHTVTQQTLRAARISRAMDESYRDLKQRIEAYGASSAGGAGQTRGQPLGLLAPLFESGVAGLVFMIWLVLDPFDWALLPVCW